MLRSARTSALVVSAVLAALLLAGGGLA